MFGPYTNPQLKMEFGLLALLQIRRPLRTLINGSSALADAAVAFQRITDIGLKVSGDEGARDRAQHTPPSSQGLRSLSLKAVQFRYGGGIARMVSHSDRWRRRWGRENWCSSLAATAAARRRWSSC